MRHVLLLRGVNVGGRRRVPMAELRGLLGEAGYADVATYVQSGNVVLTADERSPARLAGAVSALIGERFGFEVPVQARSRTQLAAVIAHDPIPEAASDPKRYQVTFLERPPSPAQLQRLRELALETEPIATEGRELYTWHPDGMARSRLATGLSSSALGPAATSRNWRTVTTLAEMAGS